MSQHDQFSPEFHRREQERHGRSVISLGDKPRASRPRTPRGPDVIRTKRTDDAKQAKSVELRGQDKLLENIKLASGFVFILHMNGRRITGRLVDHDRYTVIVNTKFGDTRKQAIVYKHAIDCILPLTEEEAAEFDGVTL